jgi:hypothetical protein
MMNTSPPNASATDTMAIDSADPPAWQRMHDGAQEISELIEELSYTATTTVAAEQVATIAQHRHHELTITVAGSDPLLVSAAVTIANASIRQLSMEGASRLVRHSNTDGLVDLALYALDVPRARDVVTLQQRPPAPQALLDPVRSMVVRDDPSLVAHDTCFIDDSLRGLIVHELHLPLRASAALLDGSLSSVELGIVRSLDPDSFASAQLFVMTANEVAPTIDWRAIVTGVGLDALQAVAGAPTPAGFSSHFGHDRLTRVLRVLTHEPQWLIDLTVMSELLLLVSNQPTSWPSSVSSGVSRKVASWRRSHLGLSQLDLVQELSSTVGLSVEHHKVLLAGLFATIARTSDQATSGSSASTDSRHSDADDARPGTTPTDEALVVAERLAFHPRTSRPLATLARRLIDALD